MRAPEFIHRFTKAVEDIAPARYFVRAKQHQKASIKKLVDLQESAGEVKQELVSKGNTRDANLILSIECMTGGLIGELEMIVALKENRPNDAWDHLLAAQNSAEAAARAHSVAEKMSVDGLLSRLNIYEQLLFPSLQFVSPAFDVGSMVCSVCTEEYATCPHIKGRAYAGEFCSVKLRDVHGFDHLALVDEPFSKAHRVTATTSGLDMMTLLPPEECNPDDSVVTSADIDGEGQPDIGDEERPEINSDLETIDSK